MDEQYQDQQDRQNESGIDLAEAWHHEQSQIEVCTDQSTDTLHGEVHFEFC